MTKYTLETLKKENELFDSYYGLEESDVKKVNRIIEMIEYYALQKSFKNMT